MLPAAQNRTKESINAEQMKDLVEQLAKQHDFVFIDCPAGIEMGFRNAVAPASEAIVVTTPDVTAVRDADRVVGLLETESVDRIQLIVNRVRPKMVELSQMMSVEDILDLLVIPLLGIIPDDERIIIATNKGEPLVFDPNPAVPTQAFKNIAQRFIGNDVPFLDLMAGQDSFLTRLRRRLFG
jgi:septum site-determining protein MinD